MPLIVAIEPDRRQAAQVSALARRLHAELVIAEATDAAFALLGGRVPDLILTAALLPPRDEAALADRLRDLAAHASHVQTLTTPVFANSRKARVDSVLTRLRRKNKEATLEGCDPAVFAEQVSDYLQRAAAEREAVAAAAGDEETTFEMPLDPIVEAEPQAEFLEDATAQFCEDAVAESREDTAAAYAGHNIAPEPIAPAADLSMAELEESLRHIVIEESVPAFTLVEESPATTSSGVDDTGEWTTVELEPGNVDSAEQVPEIEESLATVTAAPPEEAAASDANVFVESEWMAAVEAIPTETTEPPVPAMEAEEPEVQAPPPAYQSARWMEALEALRQEVEQNGSASVPTAQPAETASAEAAPAAAAVEVDAAREAQASAAAISARKARRANEPTPVQDEWGFFDPDQCGFAALLQKLDEITDTDSKDDAKVRRPA
jgi:hypothetical protein